MKLWRFVASLWEKRAEAKGIIVNLWCGFLFLNLIVNLYFQGVHESIAIFRIIGQNLLPSSPFSLAFYHTPFILATLCLVSNFLWAHLVMATAGWLGRVHKIFKWSWLGESINLIPLSKRYLSIAFIILLMLNLPSITHFEEYIFRVGTTNWHLGIANSVLFGMMHCVIGVPLGYGISLIGLGLWLTWCYFMAGPIYLGNSSVLFFDSELFATMNHTAFNMVGSTIILILLIKRHIELERADRKLNTNDQIKN